MSQVIKYQTTKIDSTTTANQIGGLVRKYGASRFGLEWDEKGEVQAVRFAILHPEVGEIPVVLTAPLEVIRKRLPPSWDPERRREQAGRIAWRHLKDLTEQLLLAVELGLKTVPGAFMADMETWDSHTGKTTTVGELFARVAVLEPGKGLRLTGEGRP